MSPLRLLLTAALVGCVAPDSGKGGDTAAGGDTATPDSADSGDSGASLVACGDGTWGPYASGSANTLYVSAGGAGTTGTSADPVGTVAEALALAIPGTQIVVGAGSFSAQALIQDETTQQGVQIVGCGRDETSLTPTDEASPILFANDVTGIAFAGLTLAGGTRTIWLQGSAEVTVTDVLVDSPAGTGVFVYGPATVALVDVSVNTPTESADSGYAYGITIQGEPLNQANVSMEGGGIVAASPVGMIAQAAVVSVSGAAISGTLADADGFFGRGLQFQGWSTATVDGSSLDDNQDAGLFALDTLALTVTGATAISNTRAGLAPDTGASTGDGLVVALSDDADPALTYRVTVADGVKISGNARAAAVFEGVEYDVGAVVASGNGGIGDSNPDDSLFAQDGATDVGASGAVPPDITIDLNRTEAAAEAP